MFSILNNKEDVVFMFSADLKNETGVNLAKEFLKKGGSNLKRENLETLVRRGIFPTSPRKQIEKFSLRLFRIMNGLPKKEMVNYRIELSEEWQIYGSNFDLIKISIRRNELEYEKIGGRSYTGLPTYFPCFIRNT